MELENNSDLKKVQITIVYDDERESFEMDANSTILEAALDRNIDVPFSCQGGVCTSCMAKITQGKAVMENNSVLTDDEIEDGIVLTCQAHPTTATIVVDYDEV
jgi:ring-1,2-phenylacetyl-CoA epoxidase subunit PaaE